MNSVVYFSMFRIHEIKFSNSVLNRYYSEVFLTINNHGLTHSKSKNDIPFEMHSLKHSKDFNFPDNFTLFQLSCMYKHLKSLARFSNNSLSLEVSKENIHKKEVGSYRGFGYSSLVSDPLTLAKGARQILLICKFIMAVVSKTNIRQNCQDASNLLRK